LRHLLIKWPVKQRIVLPGHAVEFPELLVCKKWIMRIECLDLQEPVVFLPVLLQKTQPRIEGQLYGKRRAALERFAVCIVVPNEVVTRGVAGKGIRGPLRIRHTWDPLVAFLNAKEFPRRITVMISAAAVLEIMLMIRNEMRIHPGL